MLCVSYQNDFHNTIIPIIFTHPSLRVLPPDITRSPQVTYLSSIPCRPHTPWYDEWTSNAFASIMQARPFLIFGRPVHIFCYSLVFLRKPFRLHLTVNALPFGYVNRPLRHYPQVLDTNPLVRGSVGL